MAYIDLNPVRAGMVKGPADYPWSGHHHLAAADDSLVKLHSIYLKSAESPDERYRRYLDFLKMESANAPFSLANALFMGRRSFILKLEKRFGILNSEGHRIRLVDLGKGIFAAELLRGGIRA